ncbi:MAG: translation initiation factor IF-2, partial [Clostridia bacterium]|nr:translation initiation factor IF-2 [Clostridia bacterium]
GHEAFTSMRRRGAQVTDIAIIVVAADDGIMPQTVEALNHAKDAGVSIIVAINKIDLPAANPDRVKQELTEYGVVPEEWGGDVICVPVSAKTGENIESLLEMVLLTADVLELKANPDRQAKGTVIEAKLDAHKGVVSTMLVQKGTLTLGDCVISGTSVGRIRAMFDDKGEAIAEAGPSKPAVILGLDEVPDAGEIFYSVEDEKTARNLAERRRYDKQQQRTSRKPATLDELFGQIQEGSVKELKIIVKADVRGSVEAVTESLEKLSNDEVTVKVIHGAAGTISESDISLAEVSGAIVIGFNVRPGNNVTQAAKEAGVDVRLYRIIYNAVEDVEAAMKGMLDPKFREVVTGHAQIRQIFKVSGIGTIGGSMVTDGNIKRNSDIRVVRDGIVVYEGKLASLKRFQDDVREVQSGYECGLSVEKYNDIKENDVIEAFEMIEVKE